MIVQIINHNKTYLEAIQVLKEDLWKRQQTSELE